MEAARQAVEAFLARNGLHDTTVHETVAPAVTHETVTKREQQNVTRAVDREYHQDHYHTSVQPITHEEYREEQHHSAVQDVDEQNFEHDDPEETSRRLAESDAEHQDTVKEVVAERTTTELPAIEGMHIHHHVHERIQPVINKQTYETHVYHVVVPVREIHHNAAQHHPSSPLATVTLDQFKQSGGSLTGREERYDAFEGEPRSVGKALGGKTSAAPTTSGAADAPAPIDEAPIDEPAAAPPAKAFRVATFADPVIAAPEPQAQPEPEPEPEPTTIASRTATLSGVFRAPTRAPTAPVTLAREPTAFAPPTREPTSFAPPTRESTALAPVAREPTFNPISRSPTAPATIAREPTLPPPPAREPTIPAPLERLPTAPAIQREPTAIAREPTIAPNHPLMRPATQLPLDAYRQGPGRAGATGHPPRHSRHRSRPASTPTTLAPAEQETVTESTKRPLPDLPSDEPQ